VFAGAVRETVLSNSKNISTINNDFVPVAIRAADLNNPGPNGEGELVRSLGRSKIAPQGLCVLNSSGQALEWVIHFEGESAVASFLHHSLERFKQNQNGTQANATERYLKFPSQRLEDMQEEPRSALASAILQRTRSTAPASDEFVLQLTGRALDAKGSPLTDTLQQEHYVEHKIVIPPEIEQALSRAAVGQERRFPLPDALSRLLIQHAYLGQLDLQPIVGNSHALRELKTCSLWAEQNGKERLRIDGDSEVSVASAGRAGDGASFSNEVKLHWTGFADFNGTNLTSLLLLSRGFEKVRWASPGATCSATTKDDALNVLTAGHTFDMAANVVFGFEGKVTKTRSATVATAGLDAAKLSDSDNLPHRIQQKMSKLQSSMPAWIAIGGDQQTPAPSMHQIESLMQAERPDEAEHMLDSVLTMMNTPGHPPATPTVASAQLNLPQRIQQKMTTLQSRMPAWIAAGGNQLVLAPKMLQIESLMQGGCPDEAERMLDSALVLMDHPDPQPERPFGGKAWQPSQK
jgi:hypothetical protein